MVQGEEETSKIPPKRGSSNGEQIGFREFVPNLFRKPARESKDLMQGKLEK
jgi:hypothetical protein